MNDRSITTRLDNKNLGKAIDASDVSKTEEILDSMKMSQLVHFIWSLPNDKRVKIRGLTKEEIVDLLVPELFPETKHNGRDTRKPLTKRQKKTLHKIYYKEGKTVGRDRLYHYVRQKHPQLKISRRQLAEWLHNQLPNQLHRHYKKQTELTTFYSKAPKKIFIADLFIIPKDPYSTVPKDDEQYRLTGKYMLNVVDAFSKKAYIEPVVGTKAATVLRAMKKIFERSGKPKRLQSDNGPEFKGEFHEGMKKLDITHTYGQPNRPWNQSLVEKTNFTLASLFTGSRTGRGKKYRSWWLPDVYQKIEANYNDLPHEGIGFRTPNFVENMEASEWAVMAKKAKTDLEKRKRLVKQELNIGDNVRVEDTAKRKNPLSKGANPNWSLDTYVVEKVFKPTKSEFNYSYAIKDKTGRFMSSQLQKIAGVEKGDYINEDELDDIRDAQKQAEKEDLRAQQKKTKTEAAITRKEAADTQKKKDLEKKYLGMKVKASEDDDNAEGKVIRVEQRLVKSKQRKKRKFWGVVVKYPDGEEYWYKIGDIAKT